MTTDPYAELRDFVFRTVYDGVGHSDSAIRQAAAAGTGVPADLHLLVDKIHHHAYRVTDADVAQLDDTYTDDELFEIIVSAAVGASQKRLIAGLTALESA